MTISSENSKMSARRRSGLHLSQLKSPFKLLGNRPSCRICRRKCEGQVLKADNNFFCSQCFKCNCCGNALSTAQFFNKDNRHYCTECYQRTFGTQCGKCGKYVEGEVVSALGQTFCQQCFTCASCHRAFGVGERVTFDGKQCICRRCSEKPTHEEKVVNGDSRYLMSSESKMANNLGNTCSICSQSLGNGQILEALDKHFHAWCFRCTGCRELLRGEYMSKENEPYCEQCYHSHFGIKCTYCRRFISGKVLQAGENNHFHPTCARCTKCGDFFSDGEEMFLQGAAIWHPVCGPGTENYNIVETEKVGKRVPDDRASFDYASRASTPALRSRSVADHTPSLSGSTAHLPPSYPYGGSSRILNSNSTYSLRRPVTPGSRSDSVSGLKHFHLPPSRQPSLGAMKPEENALNLSSSRSLLSSRGLSRPASRQHDTMSLASNRALSCPPPKPGYTHQVRGARKNPHSAFEHYHIPHVSTSTLNASSTNLVSGKTQEEHKAYPLHLLQTTNYKLPVDVDRCNLEMHLADDDFKAAFGMDRKDFYALPIWRRHDLKRKLCLF